MGEQSNAFQSVPQAVHATYHAEVKPEFERREGRDA